MPVSQCLISALTQAGGGGLLLGLLVLWRCVEGLALFSPLCRSGSRLLYMECALRCARFQPSGVPQKHGLSCACVLCLPRQSRSGSQELDGALSPRAARLLLSASPAPVPARAGWVPAPCVLLRPSRRMSTIQTLRRSLIRDWRPVCSLVGAAVLGGEPAPFPSPLPPVSGKAGPVRSLRALLWT